jgi:hypothetical protein
MTTLQIQNVKVSAEPRGALAIFLVSTAPVLVAWIWCFFAWHMLPDVSMGTDEQQRRMLYVATELPHTIVGVLALLIGIAGTIYLAVKRRALVAIAFFMYQLPVQAAIFVASISFINFKPPGW